MKTIFKNCILLDGTENMIPRPGMDVLVEDEKIIKIGTELADQADKVIELDGRYLMPGLINLHVHLPAGGKPQKKPMDAVKMARLALSCAPMRAYALRLCHSNAMQGLMAGVTTIRAVGGLGTIDTTLRDRINSGRLDGPDILVANSAVGVPGGHMAGSVAAEATFVEEAVRMVEERAEQGVDLVKLMITGGVLDAKEKGQPGVLMMQPDMIEACCRAAHRYNLPVAAHVQSPEGIRAALNCGVDTIEHGSVLTEQEIEAFQRTGAKLVCTLSPAMPMAKFDREVLGIDEVVQYNSNLVFNNMIFGARTALDNNIPVGLGTDTGCPYTTHYNMWRELQYFRDKVKVSPAFALHTATLGNASVIGRDGDIGSIAEGKRADMLISQDNPLEDFRTLSEPYMVVCRGKITCPVKIKKYAKCEENLDKYYE